MSKSTAAQVQVQGIDAEKLDVKAIDAALERYGISPSPKAKLDDKVSMLKEHFVDLDQNSSGDVTIVVCNNCDAESTSDLDVCPFCGVGEDEPAGAPEGDIQATGYGDEEIPPPDSEETIPPPVVDVTPEVLEPSLVVTDSKVQKMTQVKGKGSKKSTSMAVVTPIREGVIESQSEPIVKYVAEVKQIQNVAHVSSYMLAKKLAEGEMSGVWKTKLDAKDRPVYRNFDTFAQIELGMSGKYVRTQLKLFSRFTEDQFRTIPVTKLRLLLEVAEDERPAVLKKIKEGASRRTIERSIGRTSHDAQGAKGKAKERPAPSKEGQVSVALVAKKKRFAFFQDVEGQKPAKAITGSTWARLPIATNDVEVLVTISKNDAGEIVGVVEVRRVDPTK